MTTGNIRNINSFMSSWQIIGCLTHIVWTNLMYFNKWIVVVIMLLLVLQNSFVQWGNCLKTKKHISSHLIFFSHFSPFLFVCMWPCVSVPAALTLFSLQKTHLLQQFCVCNIKNTCLILYLSLPCHQNNSDWSSVCELGGIGFLNKTWLSFSLCLSHSILPMQQPPTKPLSLICARLMW